MKYAISKESETDATIITEDGGVATIHHNDEHIVVTYYQKRVEIFTFNYKMWNRLDEGKTYLKDFHTKQTVDSEVIQDALNWLCATCKTFTQVNWYTLIHEFNNRNHDTI